MFLLYKTRYQGRVTSHVGHDRHGVAGPVVRERQGRGGENRTPANGFGDRCHTTRPHPRAF